MNTRYTETFLFLSRLSRRSNKGFALAFVCCAGVLMAGTAAVMLMRSSSEREKVIAQQTTAKGIMKADVGVARITYFFNQPQHQKLIKKPTDQWQSVADEILAASGSGGSSSGSSGSQLEGAACNGSGGSSDSSESDSSESGSSGAFDTDMFNKLLNNEWITIKTSKDVSAGEYRLTGYELDSETDPKFVNLKVEARGLAQDANTTELKSNNSVRGINVLLPIIEKTEEEEAESSIIPGLWVSDTKNGSGGDKANSKQSSDASKPNKPINAITWIDCSQETKWNNASENYVNTPRLDQTPIQIGNKNINPKDPTGDGKNLGVQQIKDDLPGLPAIPSSSKVRNMGSRNWSNCYVTLPLIDGNKSSCSVPSGTDEPIGNAYYYKFTGSVSMNLSSVQIRINPPEGKKVIIFASGIIDISGTSDFNKYDKYYDTGEKKYKRFPNDYRNALRCRSGSGTEKVTSYIGDPTDPSKLEIYSSTSDEAVKLGGQNILSAFLHAPKTKVVQISQSQIRGAAWIKAMDASNSYGSGCDRSIKQMDVGKTLVMGGEAEEGQPVTTLGQVASYQSTEAE
ncbi:MAG: hypothetical protein AB4063_03470 [Crocosphaera sp.]